MAGAVGFDFVTFDAEHEGLSDRALLHMIRAAESFDITPIARMPKDPDRMVFFMTGGVQGIHIPRCNTKAQAEEFSRATHHYPSGARTFYSLGRSANYGIGIDDSDWAKRIDAEMLTIAMIEEREAVANLSDILSVEGIDAVHFGPRDLWQSMGMPPEAEVDEVISKAIARARDAGKYVSLTMSLNSELPHKIERAVGQGVQMFTINALHFLREGGQNLLASVQGIRGA
jgi:4-hydroxy-2-oxoheptanedioate aldolase